ncbi:MAG: hypothetical protein EAZ30_02660 [Betaproteobacteria bacterium]|nr:MAG: hypothetical protein EAZ30_02660 [Betaproteobacteria bacterium]
MATSGTASPTAFEGQFTYDELVQLVCFVMQRDRHALGQPLSDDADYLATRMGEMTFLRQQSLPLHTLDDRCLNLLRSFHEQQRQCVLPMEDPVSP